VATITALIASFAVHIGAASTPVKTVAVKTPSLGSPVATLSIPRIRFSGLTHQGVGAAQLALGPGHYPSTSLPGQPGTVAFAGHRVTHTHPFLEINLLRNGDVITVSTHWGRFRYRVYREEIVSPNDTAVLRNVGFQQLVLTACHPPHTALKRYVVFARRII
jgi:sortase A